MPNNKMLPNFANVQERLKDELGIIVDTGHDPLLIILELLAIIDDLQNSSLVQETLGVETGSTEETQDTEGSAPSTPPM